MRFRLLPLHFAAPIFHSCMESSIYLLVYNRILVLVYLTSVMRPNYCTCRLILYNCHGFCIAVFGLHIPSVGLRIRIIVYLL